MYLLKKVATWEFCGETNVLEEQAVFTEIFFLLTGFMTKHNSVWSTALLTLTLMLPGMLGSLLHFIPGS